MRRTNGRHKRPIATRLERKRFLIVCEGSKTEPNYFRSFRVNAQVTIVGEGYNTVSLVDRAIQLRDSSDDPFDEVWVVFDKDDFTDAQFNAAINKAKDSSIHSAWSNESFELWYVLHFDFLQTAISRSDYIEILTRRFLSTYKKNDPNIYELLISRQSTAINNSKKLEAIHQETNPEAQKKPCTMVHWLVEQLNEHLQ